MSNFEDCNSLKDMIRHVTFLDNIMPADRQMSNFFAVQMMEGMLNKMAMTNPTTSKSILEESPLSRSFKLLELNQRMWNVYVDPLKEFQRQCCQFANLRPEQMVQSKQRAAVF